MAENGAAPQVIILLGSKTDLEFRGKIARALDDFGISHETRIASAHRVTRYLLEMLEQYEERAQPLVYITVAGRSNALSGVVDANSRYPVIACPPYSDRYAGMDLLSTVRMPGGVAPLLVLEPEAAALAAAKILAVGDIEIATRIAETRTGSVAQAIADDQDLRGD